MDLTKILNALFTSLNSHVDRGFASVVTAVKGSKSVSQAIKEQTNALRIVFNDFNKTMKKIENPQIDVTMDLGEVQKQVNGIYNLMKETESKKLSLTPLYDELRAIRQLLKQNQPEKLGDRFDALDEVFKGLKPRKTVKFDDAQINALIAAMSHNGGGFTSQGGNKSASRYNVQRLLMATANTEYTFTFPANTVSWTMKQRVAGASLLYSSVTGMFPTTGNDSHYMTLLPMGARSQDNVEWGGVKMFLQSDTASQVVEFEIFQM